MILDIIYLYSYLNEKQEKDYERIRKIKNHSEKVKCHTKQILGKIHTKYRGKLQILEERKSKLKDSIFIYFIFCISIHYKW